MKTIKVTNVRVWKLMRRKRIGGIAFLSKLFGKKASVQGLPPDPTAPQPTTEPTSLDQVDEPTTGATSLDQLDEDWTSRRFDVDDNYSPAITSMPEAHTIEPHHSRRGSLSKRAMNVIAFWPNQTSTTDSPREGGQSGPMIWLKETSKRWTESGRKIMTPREDGRFIRADYLDSSNRHLGSSNRNLGNSNRNLGSSNRHLGSSNRHIGSSGRYLGSSRRLEGSGSYGIEEDELTQGVGAALGLTLEQQQADRKASSSKRGTNVIAMWNPASTTVSTVEGPVENSGPMIWLRQASKKWTESGRRISVDRIEDGPQLSSDWRSKLVDLDPEHRWPIQGW